LTIIKNHYELQECDFEVCWNWLAIFAFTTKFDIIGFLKWIKSNYGNIQSILARSNHWMFSSLQRNDADGLSWLLNELKPDRVMLIEIHRNLRADRWSSEILNNFAFDQFITDR
jgi:hypothetical protein